MGRSYVFSVSLPRLLDILVKRWKPVRIPYVTYPGSVRRSRESVSRRIGFPSISTKKGSVLPSWMDPSSRGPITVGLTSWGPRALLKHFFWPWSSSNIKGLRTKNLFHYLIIKDLDLTGSSFFCLCKLRLVRLTRFTESVKGWYSPRIVLMNLILRSKALIL